MKALRLLLICVAAFVGGFALGWAAIMLWIKVF